MPKKAGMEAWKKKRNIEYLEQKEYRYYIFCEGQQTEPNYFNGFKRLIDDNPIYKDMVLIEIEPIGGETMFVLGQAENYVRKNHIEKGQIWCVYDKDSFPAARFDGVVTRADELNRNNPDIQYHCAWSNECIELWFILHFSFYQSNNHRSFYITYLNEEFRKRRIGKYEKNMDNIFDLLVNYGNPRLACRYARRLLENCGNKKPSESAPATRVYELAEELAKYLPEELRKRFLNG